MGSKTLTYKTKGIAFGQSELTAEEKLELMWRSESFAILYSKLLRMYDQMLFEYADGRKEAHLHVKIHCKVNKDIEEECVDIHDTPDLKYLVKKLYRKGHSVKDVEIHYK
jgi:hypothetical protein